MDGERKINISEGVPLNTSGAANIFVNAGKNTKVNSPSGTVIHLKTEKSSPADVGVHINTTFSIASSKKIKFLFILNFLLSMTCMIISCSVAFYYWNEMSSMRRHLDTLKDQLILQKSGELTQDRVKADALISMHEFPHKIIDRESRMDATKDDSLPNNPRKYYVKDLEHDMLFVNSRKDNVPILPQKEMLVAHFNGAMDEINLGTKAIIGPWARDEDVSSKDSDSQVELTNNEYVTIKEDGLYFVYAQVVYLSQAPNCYFIFAKNNQSKQPRLLTSCSTGDDSSSRPLNNSQLSCAVQTVARLRKGDIVNLAQREHNRTLWLRPGYTYFGFVKLSS